MTALQEFWMGPEALGLRAHTLWVYRRRHETDSEDTYSTQNRVRTQARISDAVHDTKNHSVSANKTDLPLISQQSARVPAISWSRSACSFENMKNFTGDVSNQPSAEKRIIRKSKLAEFVTHP
jgi:hypothetical protein